MVELLRNRITQLLKEKRIALLEFALAIILHDIQDDRGQDQYRNKQQANIRDKIASKGLHNRRSPATFQSDIRGAGEFLS